MVVDGTDGQPEEPHRNEQEDAFNDDDAEPVAGELPSEHVDEKDEGSFLIPYVTIWDTAFGSYLADKLEEVLVGH